MSSRAIPALVSDSIAPSLARAQAVLQLESEALKTLADSLSEAFTRAVEGLMKLQGRVIVTGMGKSGYVARKIAATLASTGTPAFFVHPAEASHGDMGMITPQDGIIALSNSGETSELNNLLEYSRRQGIFLVGITQKGQSTLGRGADICLTLPPVPEACPMGLAPTTSTTMMMALGDAIAIALLEQKNFQAADFKMLHPGGSLGRQLLYIQDLMHQGEELPLVLPTDRMKEVLLVMTGKRFGCVGIVDETGQLCGVITDGDLRRHMSPDLLQKQAQEIMSLHPLALKKSMLAAEGLGLFNQKGVTNAFVLTADGKPEGLVHIHDFLRAGIT